MPLLAPTDSFFTALHQCSFYIGTATIAFITWTCTYCINYFFVARNNPDTWVLFNVNSVIDIVAVTVFVSAAFSFSCRAVRSRIIYGYQPPLAASAYASNWFKRIFFFSLSVPTTWKRAILFVLNCLLVPAAILVAILAGSCEAVKYSKASSRTDKSCHIENVHGFVAFDATWRSVLIIAISTMNYLAAHHEGQKAFKNIPRQRNYVVENERNEDEHAEGVVVEEREGRQQNVSSRNRQSRLAQGILIEMVSPQEAQFQPIVGNEFGEVFEAEKQTSFSDHSTSQSATIDNNAIFQHNLP